MENLLINGFGSSGGGTYQTVELNGKGTINGDIDCERFTAQSQLPRSESTVLQRWMAMSKQNSLKS